MRDEDIPALPKLLTAVVRAAPTSCSGLYTNACTQAALSLLEGLLLPPPEHSTIISRTPRR